MRDIMVPMAFDKLIRQCLTEYRTKKSLFDVKAVTIADENKRIDFCGRGLENPLGVAAGPHTQLAQNIVACYAGGARFIELKTVQRMYGEELGIQKPCIRANDEGYNVEWSSELHALEAMNEYIRAWFAVKVVAKEFGLGNPDAFQFNMSVGYDLAGIQSQAVDGFLNGLHDASSTKVFKECKEYLLNNLDLFQNIDADFINSIPAYICNTVTLSTMHGCPADEIEKIAAYLIEEKGFNTFIKCNPTLLGYDYVRKIMDEMGYDYLSIDKHQFEVDLKFDQAVKMINNLLVLSRDKGVTFGVKLCNTMPVEIKHEELPGETMYMSGKSLYPLAISLAKILGEAVGDELEISFSGGADKNNIDKIFEAGIYPITVCTTLLQPMGYEKLAKLHEQLHAVDYPVRRKLDLAKISELVESVKTDKNYCKSEVQRKKTDEHIDFRGVSEKDNLKCKVLCQTCIRVCPNRANTFIETTEGKIILHIDDSCNECGNCQYMCIQPCMPYRDRLTYFSSRDMMAESENKGLAIEGDRYFVRLESDIVEYRYEELSDFMKSVVDSIKKTHSYLI